ncbi:acetyltransferase [Colletotrichum graminicola]|uniref:Acetyltransferase n=1 Tax=Colletotrichum graminicola (strain M1.001 / M2 / FGSC 10212) TaxID=645133 RepID=E3QN31_COLGM|nr:acetyltransferase [Colletotrichum graminicola M1.001]EFQ32269.1 acetyltransferase [Colletotrichum graminicola M1.001]WDK19843.1 acetyltransferase [Colletotrichum graminicola]
MAEYDVDPDSCNGGYSFVRATSHYVSEIHTIVKAAYSKYIDRIGKEPAPMKADYNQLIESHMVYVLENDQSGQVVGAILLRHDPAADALHIDNMVVAPAAQGRGFGHAFMECAEDVARACECTNLQLYTNVKMVENLVIYPKLGFVETERRTEDGYERVYFRRDLEAGK